MSTINEIHSKCDILNGGVGNGLKQPIPFGLILKKPAG